MTNPASAIPAAEVTSVVLAAFMVWVSALVQAVINALRNGTKIPDPELEALHHFTTLVVRNRGWVSEADIDAFLAAGYTRRNVLEVILGVATKVMSNYTNHIARTELDKFMLGNEWIKPVVTSAA
jgi:alkylhydroperoxidase family enzyme